MQHLLKKFLHLESSSGIILFAMAVLAMVLMNSPLAYLLQEFIDTSLFWINEGLMAIFFLLVGLELKRSYLEGDLSQVSQVALPGIAAIGGMLIPALCYVAINYDNPTTLRGWATPVATDIAAPKPLAQTWTVPPALKLFLMALAIFDDVGAILIIAFFYTSKLSFLLLLESGLFAFTLYLLNRLEVKALLPYLVLGIGLWFSLLHSGIHPTIAGVILALTIPGDGNSPTSPLHRLELRLHPWVAYLIMPLFALANAGFSFANIALNDMTDVVVIGIIAGLFIGKQVGVMGFASLLIRLGFAKLPDKSTWWMLYGVALLCGIGFTMSLFLGTLSFQNRANYLAEVRLGVLIGSLLSGLLGSLVLYLAFSQRKKKSA